MPQPRPPAAPLLALSLILLIAGCQPAAEAPATTRTVLVQTVTPAAAMAASITGEIRARHETDLAFRVGGKIAARLVDVGASVTAGQALARLDPADLQLAADAARAQLAAAESDLATARAERERYAGLVTKKFVSQAAFEARDNAFKAAAARLEQARSQAQLSGNQAGYATLTGSFPAVVVAVLADAGQVIAAGQPVLRVARPEEKEVAIAVPESRLAEFQRAASFSVELWADPQAVLAGELRELAPAADPATRTYAARIRLKNPPPGLALGMSARVTPSDAVAGPLLVPLAAVVDRGQGPRVLVVADGKVAERAVRVAAFRDDGAAIAEGLQAGELVVVAGAARLVAGESVTPRFPAAPERQR